MHTFNLTCPKTHILAWINLDDSLSLKINGVKYKGFPKLDKRGEKYWKVESLISSAEPKTSLSSSLNKKELALVESYQARVKANQKMSDFSKAEVDAYGKWKEEQERNQQLKEKLAKNESTSP